ncbi:MAG: OmpH family outer membrane protein [Bacteroidales bacterium]|nr:OmpH family outer membrane protein [Bacteroidales bacterium]
MNKIIKVFFLTAALFVVNGFVSAQTLKIAHVNTNEIMNDMPERTKAEKDLENYYNELQEQLKTMYGEYQNKLQDYQANVETMSNLVKQSKEKELADLESRITAFQSNAEGDFDAKRAELLQPLLEKIQNAINAVGKEKGYTYVIDLATGAAVYVGTDAVDITKDVKAKLGIKK